MHACINARMMHACINARMMHAYMHVYTHTHAQIICMYVYALIPYVCARECMYVYMCVRAKA
jgi:hypothetical protein